MFAINARKQTTFKVGVVYGAPLGHVPGPLSSLRRLKKDTQVQTFDLIILQPQ
jgi:hypothetical protein